MQKLAEKLRAIAPDRLFENEPMSKHTTFRVGGPADLMFYPESRDEIIAALEAAKEENVPVHVIGNGSNLLVRDGGIRGLVIVLGDEFARVCVDGDRIYAEAGVRLSRIAMVAQENGLTGLEFAGGIPGTLGGGCMMNAGAYGGQLSDVLVSCQVLLDGELKSYSVDEMEMGYRTTMPLKKGGVVFSAEFRLKRGDPAAIAERMRDLAQRRRDKQPLNMPSAGSTFKRPEGHFAGALIEGCGLKGYSVGGAQVSEKHAGFVVNTGNATAKDILGLIEYIQKTVFAEKGVTLEPEVRIIGEE
ncbi:MAG: UDP-N-acetylmuramate dehydrogenase [Clostridia bacterium]|nr:UDP-N-acetylmuramate dehydrogenase [Clostridia bacterium]